MPPVPLPASQTTRIGRGVIPSDSTTKWMYGVMMSWSLSRAVRPPSRASATRALSSCTSVPASVVLPMPILKPLYSGGLCEPVIMQRPSTGSTCAAK